MSRSVTSFLVLLAGSAALSGCVSDRWGTYAWLSLNDDFEAPGAAEASVCDATVRIEGDINTDPDEGALLLVSIDGGEPQPYDATLDGSEAWSIEVDVGELCTPADGGECESIIGVRWDSGAAWDRRDTTLVSSERFVAVRILDDRAAAYVDGDGDGQGSGPAVYACDEADLADLSATDDDCDDTDAARFPGNPEVCDDIDNDCDGVPDNGLDENTFYLDSDGDGFGDPASTDEDCADTLDGYVRNADDCDDTRDDVYLDADELCDGVDNNCDDNIDEAFTFQIYFRDADGDGAGTPTDTDEDCAQPAGYVGNPDDCDDTDPLNYFGNDEVCDDQDNDCDGLVDSADPSNTEGDDYYVDLDGDGLIGPNIVKQCEPPIGTEGVDWSSTPPIAFDNADCDDDPITGPDLNFVDADGDLVTSCPTFPGELPDCDDNDPERSPTNPEQVDADDVDEDCDLAIDCYVDVDDDGVGSDAIDGDALPVGGSCDAPANGLSSLSGDCADAPGFDFIYPGAYEVYGNGWDEDCSDFAGCYDDTDGDGYGEGQLAGAVAVPDATVEVSCDDPLNNIADDDTDCDDNAASVYPLAPELIADGIDQDCDLADSCYADVDMDGYGSNQERMNVVPAGVLGACDDPSSGYADDNTDCDDNPIDGSERNPGLTEIVGDGIDQNCDVSEADSCYTDGDNDDYGIDVVLDDVAQLPGVTCQTLDDAAPTNDDCDDGNPFVNPNPLNVESPDNNDDDDCNGTWSCYVDGDGDDVAGTSTGNFGDDCLTAGAFIAAGNDCDDTDDTRFPGNTAGFCDGNDDNCVGGDEFVLNTTQDAVYAGGSATEQLTNALAAAADGDILELCDAQTFTGEFSIAERVDLLGTNSAGLPAPVRVQQSVGGDSVFTVTAGGAVNLEYLDVQGDPSSAATLGGCLNVQGGNVVLNDVNFTGCYADRGGAVYVASGASLDWTTGACSGSEATVDHGGAISSSGQLTLNAVDLADNVAAADGGALFLTGTSAALWTAGSCYGNVASRGGCLFADAATSADIGDGVGTFDLILVGDSTAYPPTTSNTATTADQIYVIGEVTINADTYLDSVSGNATEEVWVSGGGFCWEDAGFVADFTIIDPSNPLALGDPANLSTENYCTSSTCQASCPPP